MGEETEMVTFAGEEVADETVEIEEESAKGDEE